MTVDRAHERNAVDMIAQLDGLSLRGHGIVAIALAGVAHALLDVAQAIREGHVRG